jgi:RNA recognition motif-containing protein
VEGAPRRLYVDNLASETSESELSQLFGAAGGVSSVRIVRDDDTGAARGFAFVDMANEDAALNAVNTLHESYFRGRVLSVKLAPRLPGGVTGLGRPRGNRRW